MSNTLPNVPLRLREYSGIDFANLPPIVPLSVCEYNKHTKVLKLASEFFGMPREFIVYSETTGKEVRFTAIGEHDILFSQDQWDGEQQIYRPVGVVDTIDHMVIYHAW